MQVPSMAGAGRREVAIYRLMPQKAPVDRGFLRRLLLDHLFRHSWAVDLHLAGESCILILGDQATATPPE